MPEAWIVAGLRTPLGRYGGSLASVRPDDMAALVVKEVIARFGADPEEIEDVVLGCTNQAGEDSRNVARNAALLAGLPVSVPGVSVNRLCGSGLEAVNYAAREIQAGSGEVFVAGGVESMSRAPFVMGRAERAFPRGNQTFYDSLLGWRFPNPALLAVYPPYSLGETAENVVERYEISRHAQDEFALGSHQKAVAAQASGRFAQEIVPVPVDGQVVDTDEHPRPDTSMEALARLEPVFREGGTVTAGNSSGVNDGAAALVLASPARGKALANGQPVYRVLATAVAGVDPSYMGLGPIPATHKALQRAGLTMDDLDLVELNEAFAGQALAVVRDLQIPEEKLNVNGGAVALGHPVGCSGARLMVTLIHEMGRREARLGLATLCIGVGQGIATIIERVD